MTIKTKNQAGFTVLEIILGAIACGLLVTAGALAYQRISDSSARSQSSGTSVSDKRPIAIDTEEEQKVQTPPPQPEAKPAPPPPAKTSQPPPSIKKPYNYISLQLKEAQINANSILIWADLPGSYSGKCSLTLRHYTTEAKIYQEVAISGATCTFELPKSELAGGQWKYYINFYGNDAATKGETAYKTFSL